MHAISAQCSVGKHVVDCGGMLTTGVLWEADCTRTCCIVYLACYEKHRKQLMVGMCQHCR